jgi:eukaryotic-like serine/threonine-protein kinase
LADPVPFKYRAFLSYSHRDKAWGEWLHRALETYRIGRDLVGRTTPVGPLPATLRPIFRDREDFSAGHSLAAATIAALEASQFLIVVCSPNAAKSEYVNEEVRRFKALGRGAFIIPVIVGGNPGGGDDECFPPALRFKVGSDGMLTGEREEPIAADVRGSGDGKGLALGKVVAGLLGVGLDEIIRRAERERRRRTRFWSALAGVFLALAIIATGSAVYAWQQLKTNEEFLDATLDRFSSLVTRAVGAGQSYSLPLRVTLGFLEEAEGMLTVMARYGRPTPRLRQRQIAMLIAFGDSYRQLGRIAEAERRIVEAQRLASELARDNAADPIWRREQARAQQRRGDLEMARGDLAEALRQFRSVQEIIESLIKADSDNPLYQRDLALAIERIGMVQVAQRQFAEAFASFKAVLALRQRLVEALPNSLDRQVELAVAYERIGEIERAHDDLDAALASFRASLALFERVAKATPDDLVFLRYLSVAQFNVGTLLHARGQHAEALVSLKAAFAIDERLAKSDPDNADWQLSLSLVHQRLGDVLAAQNSPDEALTQFQTSLAIREVIAGRDPDNVSWQSDLAGALERVGNALTTLKRNDEAQAAYLRAVTIYEALLARSPDSAALLFGSAMPLMRLGMLQGIKGVPHLERALAILKELDATGRLEPRRRPMIAVVEGFVKELRAQAAPH